MQFETWLAFCSISFIASFTPGPAILLSTTHTLQYGLSKSVVTMCGNISGLLIMASCSIAGLSAIILTSTLAFTVIKFAGALYLFYLGIKIWRAGLILPESQATKKRTASALTLYSQGVMVALTNPKAIVFTTALFPQFISPTQPLTEQFIILVVTFMANSFISLFIWAVMSSRISRSATNPRYNRWLGKVFGGLFAGAGAALLAVQR